MYLLEIIKVIFLGIVEGITEWLPISSTGHMVLFDEFFKISGSSDFKDLFFVVIQVGAILAVVLLYFRKLNPFAPSKTKEEKLDTWRMWFKVFVASIPAGIVGVLFDDQIDAMLTGDFRAFVIGAALIIYGILFIMIESKESKIKYSSEKDITYKTAFLIGIFQMLALVPGTSRSGSTILGMILLGFARPAAAEFSFFMSVPAMLGGSGIKLLKFVLDGKSMTGAEFGLMIIGTVVSFIVSVIAIKFLISYIKKHDFKAFGYYRIILGVIVILYFALM